MEQGNSRRDIPLGGTRPLFYGEYTAYFPRGLSNINLAECSGVAPICTGFDETQPFPTAIGDSIYMTVLSAGLYQFVAGCRINLFAGDENRIGVGVHLGSVGSLSHANLIDYFDQRDAGAGSTQHRIITQYTEYWLSVGDVISIVNVSDVGIGSVSSGEAGLVLINFVV